MKTLVTLLILSFSFSTLSQVAGEQPEKQPKEKSVVPQYYRGPAIGTEMDASINLQEKTAYQMNPWEYYFSMQRVMMQMMMTQQLAFQATLMNMMWPHSMRANHGVPQNNAPRKQAPDKQDTEIKVLPQKSSEEGVKSIEV